MVCHFGARIRSGMEWYGAGMNFKDLSDDELLSGVHALVGDGRRLLARLIAYLGEVEERRLDLAAACSSLFDFCVRRLGMSDGEAFRRMTAARLSRRFPGILSKIEQGEVHLSALVLLRDYLTEENHEDLLHEVSRKTKREVQELIAARFPKPDAPSRIRELPSELPLTAILNDSSEAAAPARSSSPSSPSPAKVEPLSAGRYKVEFTASAELRGKLEQATALMRHRNPTGDLGVVFEKALDVLLAKLERERLRRISRPRCQREVKPDETQIREQDLEVSKRETSGKDRKQNEKQNENENERQNENESEGGPDASAPRRECIPAAVRREVHERDGGQCTFLDARGRRCPSRAFLELDHVHPVALGGTNDAANLRTMCRMHNRWMAERIFGRAHVEARIRLRQRKSRAARLTDTGGAEPQTFETATRALTNLGFRDAEVRRALGIVKDRVKWTSPAPSPASVASVASVASLASVLREAIAVLTS
jgi:5-methylcytosine-specific restriction endonuclease McrA